MRERSTDDLGQELMGAPNIDAYIEAFSRMEIGKIPIH